MRRVLLDGGQELQAHVSLSNSDEISWKTVAAGSDTLVVQTGSLVLPKGFELHNGVITPNGQGFAMLGDLYSVRLEPKPN